MNFREFPEVFLYHYKLLSDLFPPQVWIKPDNLVFQPKCLRALLRFAPLPITGFHRSPFCCIRFKMFRIVNWEGSSFAFTSSHSSGVETVAPGFGRTE